METKKCTKCQVERSVDQFSKCGSRLQAMCKECRSVYNHKNREHISAVMKEYNANPKNKEHKKEYTKQNEKHLEECRKARYEQNKEHFRNLRKERYKGRNKLIYAERTAAHYIKNRDTYCARTKKYYAENKALIISKSKQQKKRQYETDPLFRAKIKLRGVVRSTFKRIGKSKPTNTLKLLGCSWEEAKLHFEKLFQPGMSWNNMNEWHIDHIRPVADWKEDELHLMNHISNLQPLWAEDNLIKGSKIL